MIKKELLSQINNTLDEKIVKLKMAIVSAKEARDNETKSSVGDKYETGRTLMQQEVEKNRVLLKQTEHSKSELSRLNPIKKIDAAGYGCIVKTNQYNYFISSAFGKMSVDNETYFCISLASPIGKLLHTKKVGDKFIFQGKEIIIQDVL